jgi:hypothetical protein
MVAGVALAVTAGLFTWNKQNPSNFVYKFMRETKPGSASAVKNPYLKEIVDKAIEIAKPITSVPPETEVKVSAPQENKVVNLTLPKVPHPSLESVHHLDRERLVSGDDVAGFVARKFCNQIFVYPGSGGERYLGDKLKDVKDDDKLVKVLETRVGAGEVIVGAAETGSLVSCLLPSEALIYTLPTLSKIVVGKKPVVFHVNSRSISANHSVVSDYGAVFNAGNTGVPIIGSGTTQEVHDFAIISHVSALRSKSPFFYILLMERHYLTRFQR